MSKKTIPIQKICPSCNQPFDVCPLDKKSRFYPKNDQVFCSRSCAYKGRYRHGSVCNILTTEQAAYMAGFFDGEGSVILYMRRDVVAMRAAFANTDFAGLETMRKWTGAGSYSSKKQMSGNHKIGYTLSYNGDAALSLFEQIETYIVLKKKQVNLAIEFQHRLHNPSLKADHTWQYEFREQVQLLNKRGY